MVVYIVAAVAIVGAWVLALVARRAAARQAQFFAGADKANWPVWAWGILLFGVMMLGILARYYWDLLGRGRYFVDTDLVELIRPLLVSPLVFFPVWSQLGGAPRTLTTILVAFQNGFFWQAVFEKAHGTVS